MNKKQPRHYAVEIMALPCKKQRKKLFNEAPEQWKALIKKHCDIMHNKQPI